jgi:hypothetical protein
VPVRDILVRDSRGDVKHEDSALALDIISIAKSAEFLLAGSIPDIEADGAEVGCESQRVDFNTKSS